MNINVLRSMTTRELIKFLETENLFELEKLMLEHLIKQQMIIERIRGY